MLLIWHISCGWSWKMATLEGINANSWSTKERPWWLDCVCVCHYLLFRYQQGDQLGTIGCSLPMFRVSRDPSWSLLVLIMEHQQEGMIYQILPIRAYNHQYSSVRQPEKTKEDLRIGRQNAVSICGCVCIVLYDVHVMGYSKPNTISWLV